MGNNFNTSVSWDILDLLIGIETSKQEEDGRLRTLKVYTGDTCVEYKRVRTPDGEAWLRLED